MHSSIIPSSQDCQSRVKLERERERGLPLELLYADDLTLGTGIRGLMRGMATLPKVTSSL